MANNVADIVARYEQTISTLTEQVYTQQQQINDLKSLLLFTIEQQSTKTTEAAPLDTPAPTKGSSAKCHQSKTVVVPTKDGVRVPVLSRPEGDGEGEEGVGTNTMYVFNSEEHELHWKTLVDGMVREALYTHMSRLDEQLACSIGDRLRRVTREHVVTSVDKEFRRLGDESERFNDRHQQQQVDHYDVYNSSSSGDGGRRRASSRHHNDSSAGHIVETPNYSELHVGGGREGGHDSIPHLNSSAVVESQASLLNQSRTLVDDIRRLKTMLGGGKGGQPTSMTVEEVMDDMDPNQSRVHVESTNSSTHQRPASATTLTERLLGKFKSRVSPLPLHPHTVTGTSDPHHRPKSAKLRHRGDANIAAGDTHQEGEYVVEEEEEEPPVSSTVFYRKPQQQHVDPQSRSDQRHRTVRTGMEWSHLGDEDGTTSRPSAIVDMSRRR